MRFVLHGVTHPCPEDLAVLVVHNGTDKYLLMSNAGGCRALEGTDMSFSAGAGVVPIPDTQGPTPAYGSHLFLSPSTYGPQPVFPAPAPAGPYTAGMPTPTTVVSGTWDLYVLDTRGSNRGAVTGGWSVLYDPNLVVMGRQVNVGLPGTGTAGPAAAYPITFDLSTVRVGVLVESVIPSLILSHTYPEDIRLALQSPAGTTVILMANAGGAFPLLPGTNLRFGDFNPPLPDGNVITSGSYSPSSFGTYMLGAPAPPGPYATLMSAFRGEEVRGEWRLWAFDAAESDVGVINSATLSINTQTYPVPVLPPTLPATHTQPFFHLTGTFSDPTVAGNWRVTNAGVFYDSGPFLFEPGTTTFGADVPLKHGVNEIIYWFTNTPDASQGVFRFIVTVDEFTYSFAEGAAGGFFDLDLTMANPAGVAAPISIDFLPEGGAPPISIETSIAANAPLQFSADTVVTGAASSVIHSVDAVPLAAERTMTWDSTGYGGHGGTAVAPDTRWLFAEGAQGFFSTFILLANDNVADAAVSLRFLREDGSVLVLPVTVKGKARRTIFAGDIAGLVNRSFSTDITSSLPIIAERAMYLPGPRTFEGGHESAGVNAPSRVWFLAEGATGSFFECFVLLGNPNPIAAHTTMTYLLPSGATVVRSVTIPANSRVTINVETVDPALAAADVSTTIVSDIGIVAERAMYWPDFSLGWREAHNSFGVTSTGLRWGLADGRIGGPRSYQSFVLLANPNPQPAEVTVRFLKAAFVSTRSYTLAPLSRRSIFVNNEVPELGDGVFSVDVRVQNYQPIAVEKALYWNAGTEIFAGGTNVTATRLPPP
jgi:subtilisin-like proprotein convertase family protein